MLRLSGNHACYRWQHGDVDDYRFRAGDSACGAQPLGVTEPVAREPTTLDPVSWQLDRSNASIAPNVFAWLASHRDRSADSSSKP